MPDLETWKRWWNRIQYETPPWAWEQDPYLKGVTIKQFQFLRNLEAEPTFVPEKLQNQ